MAKLGGFSRRLRESSEPGPIPRIEFRLSAARVILAVASLVAVQFDFTGPAGYASLTSGLVWGYILYSSLILLLLTAWSPDKPLFGHVTVAIDVLWITSIFLFSQGANTPFFPFFVLIFSAVAYRSGLRETLWTAFAAVGLLFGEAVVFMSGSTQPMDLLRGPYETNRLTLRAAYLLLMGWLIGYLAEAEKQVRAETAFIARVNQRVQQAPGMERALHAIFSEILQLYQAEKIRVVGLQRNTHKLFLVESDRASGERQFQLRFSELRSRMRDIYLFPAPVECWQTVAHANGLKLLTLDGHGEKIRAGSWSIPQAFLTEIRFAPFLAATFSLGDEWTGRVFVQNPSDHGDQGTGLRFLQELVRAVSPAVYNLQRLQRVRSQARAFERSGVARELHDGALQPLIAAEMQADVLRRQAQETTNQFLRRIAEIQNVFHQEIVGLRDLMERVKPIHVGPGELLDFLRDLVQKFQRETGIAAEFVSDTEEVKFPVQTCRELARVVQEALVNARKHGHAEHVRVWVGVPNGNWKLVIEDDGRGFDFSGRRSHQELDAAHKGPKIIKERVRSISANFAIESRPGGGARLEISLPRESDD
jgi:signal transduction histidine kinase